MPFIPEQAEPVPGGSPPSSNEIAEYARSRGLSENHVRGLLANIQAESSFQPGVEVNDLGKMAGGLFQHRAERLEGLKAAVPNWQSNWRGQIDYALSEPEGRKYVSQNFASPSDAARWFTVNFERPANMEQKAQERAAIAEGGGASMNKFASAPKPTSTFIPETPKSTAPKPSLVEDIKDKFAEGISQFRTGEGEEGKFLANLLMRAGALFTNTKPMDAPEIISNLYNRGLGLSKSIYSIPGGAARQYVGRPLKEAGYETLGPIAEAVTETGLSVGGGGLPKIAKFLPEIPGIFQLADKIPSLGARLGAKAVGKALDPLATSSKVVTVESRINEALGKRDEAIAAATDKLTEAKKVLSDKELQEGLTRRFTPAEPVPPTPMNFPGQIITPVEGRRMAAGEKFKEVLPQETKRLFGESSKNYEKVLRESGDILVDEPALEHIRQVTGVLGEELRANRATQLVEKQIAPEEIQAVEQLKKWVNAPKEDRYRQIPAALIEKYAAEGLRGSDLIERVMAETVGGAGQAVTVGNLIRLRQITREFERGAAKAGNLNARNSARQVENAITDIIGPVTREADVFHRKVHELVGPDSLAQKVFQKSPEQVVDSLFLPSTGARPNLSTIRKAKQIYQAENPQAWQDLTTAAVERLQQRSLDKTSLSLDPEAFHKNWLAYRETFKEALPPTQFNALDSLERMVADFSTRNLEFMRLNDQFKKFGKVQKQATSEVEAAQRGVEAAEKGVTSAQTFEMSNRGAMGNVINPWTMMAMAQFGQALAASMTGNITGVMMQTAQGLIWLTAGNPMFLVKLAQNPKVAQGLIDFSKAVRTGEQTISSLRVANALAHMGQSEIKNAESKSQ